MSRSHAILVTLAVAVIGAGVVALVALAGKDYPDADDAKAAIRKALPSTAFAKGPKLDGGEIVIASVPTGAGTTRVAVGLAPSYDDVTTGFTKRFERTLGRGWGEFTGCSNWVTVTDLATRNGDDAANDVQKALGTVTPKDQRCGP